jgi:hypothetical protein
MAFNEKYDLKKQILEMEIKLTRCNYFKAKSELRILQAIEDENYECAAQERDNIKAYKQTIVNIRNNKIDLLKHKK